MADNSGNRKKVLVVSVLSFLLAGGGIFLFFVIQGSNDITGKGKNNNFSYGSAAREGVVSLFRTVGFMPDEEELQAKRTEARMEARGFLPDGQPATADLSSWMNKASDSAPASPSGSFSRPAAPTAISKMAARAGAPVGGGGGSSKSAGSLSRYGGESNVGATSVSNKSQASASGTTDKGTLGSLKNAKALLGEGLRSDSAMTAQSKWGQSFGAGPSGGSRAGDLAYNKTGLVSLDKIKSGEIASLKTTKAVPEAGAFLRDKEAEKKDSNLQAAKEAASEKSKKDQEKKDIANTLASAGGDALDKSGDKPGDDRAAPGADPGKAPITDEEKETAKSLAFFQPEPLGDGASMQDTKVDITRNPDGSADMQIHGNMVLPDGTTEPYTDTVTRMPDGSLKWKDDK